MKMKTGLLGFWMLALAASAWAEKTALVTQIQGNVKVGGAPLKIAQRLDSGARLEVPAGASVTLVYLTDAHKETLKGQGYLVVGKPDHKGEFSSQSGPGSIAAVPTGNTGQAGVGHTLRGSLARLQLEPGPAGLELRWKVFTPGARQWTEYQPANSPLDICIYPYDPALGGRSEKPLFPRSEVKGIPAGALFRVVLPKDYRLQPDTPYWISQIDSGADVEAWAILQSPERASRLKELKAWAYTQPLQPKNLLSYAHICYEWQDFRGALDAAEEAYQHQPTGETKDLLRKLYRLNQCQGLLYLLDHPVNEKP